MANTYLTSKQWKEIVEYVKNRMSGKENCNISVFDEKSIIDQNITENTESFNDQSTIVVDELIGESSVCGEFVLSDSEV